MTNGWKVTGIVFLILFIVENILLAGAIIWLGISVSEGLEKEEICINLCEEDVRHDSFMYTDGICYCLEEVKSQYIG